MKLRAEDNLWGLFERCTFTQGKACEVESSGVLSIGIAFVGIEVSV